MEPDTKINLSDLSKIPPKEFEKNFREWLDRDDVARSLQAQLRMDLIKNFNKTALGRQILSQATSTNRPYGGSTTVRLTLSPMVLALNTLVAEFLYAENCHFSLSVFCTEIPFRNTLPDFENLQHFRFTESEICEILEAVYGTAKYEKDVQNKIIRDYEANARSPLLLQILKHVLSSVIQEHENKTQKSPRLQKKSKSSESLRVGDGKKGSRFETKAKKTSNKLHYVNKYLITLSNKLQCMSKQLYQLQLQQQQKILPRPRCLKSASQHSLMNLNRSLEIITGNLKKMALTKRKNKRIDVIVKAIEAMSNQFEKCARNFEKISTNVVVSNENIPKREMSTTMPEKSYSEWLNELRSSKHGQRFLDKVESSLRKALNKQKKFLADEIETKLRHQKELLKIRYKQKLMKHMPRRDASLEFDRLNKSVEKQLEQFELKHCEMVQRLHEEKQKVVQNALPSKIIPATIVEIKKPRRSITTSTTTIAAKPTEALVITLQTPEWNSSTKSPIASPKSLPKPPVLPKSFTIEQESNKAGKQLRASSHTVQTLKSAENHLDEMLHRIAADERKVDNIVFDAKLRLHQLEIESDQLEQNFHQYLERQQKQKQICREASATMWNNYLLEKNKIENKYNMLRHATQSVPSIESNDFKSVISNNQDAEREYKKFVEERNAKKIEDTYVDTIKDDTNSTSSSNCRNAILEAKARVFQHGSPKNNDKDTKKNIDKKSIHPELKNKLNSVEYHYKPKSETRRLRDKLRTLDEGKKIRKRTKVIDRKITSSNMFGTTNVKQPYDTETEVTGVETNDSAISSSEVETKVLLAPYSATGVRAKLRQTDNKLHEKTQEQLQTIQPRPRVKPWTTTTRTESTDHKVMQSLFTHGHDNVGDYNGGKVQNLKRASELNTATANKGKSWDEEKPSTSKTQQLAEPKVLPTPIPSIIPATMTTTMVLQQSMAKMNRLFQNEQQRRRQITKKHKMKEQQHQQLQTLLHLQQNLQETLQSAIKHGKRTVDETTAITSTTTTTTAATITTTTAATNTSNMLVQQAPKLLVIDHINTVATVQLETPTSAAPAGTLALNENESETAKKTEEKKSAADTLSETVAALSSRHTTHTNESATEIKTEQLPTIPLAMLPIATIQIKATTAQINCCKSEAFNADNIKKVQADSQEQQEREQHKNKQQQQLQRQQEEEIQEDKQQQQNQQQQLDAEQQQHAGKQQKNNQQQREQHQELRQQLLSQNYAAMLAAETPSLHTEITDEGAVAAGNSLATSQLDVDVSVQYDVDIDDDDYDDLVLAPVTGSTMSMSSLLALQFSTGFGKFRSNGAGDDGDNDGGGNQDEEDNEFWA